MSKVYLEVGSKKVFACSVDWAGWCRSGKTEDVALGALADYAGRYAVVPERAGLRLPKSATSFDVVERVKGDATTDFGAPGVIPKLDREPLTKRQAEKLALLLDAAWSYFDEVVAGAPASLRKGPRGGGRDRDKMAAHVADSEQGYSRQLGLPIEARNRVGILDALRAADAGTRWPPRYAARRMAWHVLDHAWEMQDRSD